VVFDIILSEHGIDRKYVPGNTKFDKKYKTLKEFENATVKRMINYMNKNKDDSPNANEDLDGEDMRNGVKDLLWRLFPVLYCFADDEVHEYAEKFVELWRDANVKGYLSAPKIPKSVKPFGKMGAYQAVCIGWLTGTEKKIKTIGVFGTFGTFEEAVNKIIEEDRTSGARSNTTTLEEHVKMDLRIRNSLENGEEIDHLTIGEKNYAIERLL
jgi:hypothetical protein